MMEEIVRQMIDQKFADFQIEIDRKFAELRTDIDKLHVNNRVMFEQKNALTAKLKQTDEVEETFEKLKEELANDGVQQQVEGDQQQLHIKKEVHWADQLVEIATDQIVEIETDKIVEIATDQIVEIATHQIVEIATDQIVEIETDQTDAIAAEQTVVPVHTNDIQQTDQIKEQTEPNQTDENSDPHAHIDDGMSISKNKWQHLAEGLQVCDEGRTVTHEKGNSSWCAARAMQPFSITMTANGRMQYFEVKIVKNPKAHNHIRIGLCPKTFPLRQAIGSCTNSYAISSVGNFWFEGRYAASGTQFEQGDVIGCGVESGADDKQEQQCKTARLFFTRNGTLCGNPFPLPINADSVPLFPAVGTYQQGTVVEGIFREEDFKYDLSKHRCQ